MIEQHIHDVSRNGHAFAPIPTEEWHRLELAYREIQRRDGQAEQRAWRWERFALVLAGLLILMVGVSIWQLLDARQVQALVQTVQVTPEGQLLQIGVPVDLLAYTPQEGIWMEMLGQWVRKLRWRSGEQAIMTMHWAWVYRHTCGTARRFLQELEAKEQPFKVSDKRVTVQVKSVTKTPTPQSYQVLFAELATDRTNPMVQETLWTATFSVGRLRPLTLTDALENRLGLCTTAFDFQQQPKP